MEWEQIAEQMRLEHDGLRKQLGVLESAARRILMDEVRLLGELRGELERFQGAFRRHLAWEDRALADSGRDMEALPEEHRRQAAAVAAVVETLNTQDRPAQMLAGQLMDLIGSIREDMAREEHLLLGGSRHS
jgi:hypothetical protein